MRRRAFSLTALSVVASVLVALAMIVAASRPSLVDLAPSGIVERARRAEATMRHAARVIHEAREAEHVPSEAPDGDAAAFIGAELTPLTTTLGNLEAKRIASNPTWARVLVLRMHHAGIRGGDLVAAGLSGSFPGLDLAFVIACESLDVRVLAISSVTASSWGANQPGFTWPEIEARLVKEGVIGPATIAISLGGAGDRALDLEADGRRDAERIAGAVSVRMSVPVLAPSGFEDAVARRLDAYRRASGGRPIHLYANIGGSEASLGRSPAVLRLRNGFLPGVPFDLSRERGVMARFAERGTPVLTLLNVRDLALRWGIL